MTPKYYITVTVRNTVPAFDDIVWYVTALKRISDNSHGVVVDKNAAALFDHKSAHNLAGRMRSNVYDYTVVDITDELPALITKAKGI